MQPTFVEALPGLSFPFPIYRKASLFGAYPLDIPFQEYFAVLCYVSSLLTILQSELLFVYASPVDHSVLLSAFFLLVEANSIVVHIACVSLLNLDTALSPSPAFPLEALLQPPNQTNVFSPYTHSRKKQKV